MMITDILTPPSERATNDVSAALSPLGFIGWTLAKNQYDNYPRSYAGDWGDLIAFVETHKAPRKGVNGLTGIFGGDGRRCLDNALPRAWMPFDLDGEGGVSEDALHAVIEDFGGIEFFWYETASSKPGHRKARIICNVSRPITDAESRGLGEALVNLSGHPGFDKSVFLLSQVCYLPPVSANVIIHDGEPIDVDAVLPLVPKPKPRKVVLMNPLKPAPDARGFFVGNGLVKGEARDGLHVVCPWANEHSSNDTTGTAYFEPSATNGFAGGFKCHHAHCSHRSIVDIFRLMGV